MAQRIQNKRSSLPGRRPDGSYLEPGEIALNTNSSDPGLFFETNTGEIAKVGPTSMGISAPSTSVGYGPGEQWYDEGNSELKIWNSEQEKWVSCSAHNGERTFTVFVNSQSKDASDALSNNGTNRPFATLNRACIEVARRTILRGRLDEAYNEKYSIVLMSGENVSHNEPGRSLDDFQNNVTTFTENQELTPNDLRAFNPESGGVILPRGASLYGLDLRKTSVVPTYYPAWGRDLYNGDGSIAPRTSILKWTGGSHVTSLTFKDKISYVSVQSIDGDPTDEAILTSLEPHSFRSFILNSTGSIEVADEITLTYPNSVSRTYNGEEIASEGTYYAEPLSPRTFKLRKMDGSALLRRDLPLAPGSNTNPTEFATVTYTNSSHHRLSAVGSISTPELNEYYKKVQTAFSNITFAGQVDGAEVAEGETVIVANVPVVPAQSTDTTKNSSPYLNNVSLRSDWGMCGVINDGSLVGGFRSILANQFTAVTLQNDAEVFEVYYNGAWLSLKEAYAKSVSAIPSSVTNEQAIGYLISTVKLENVRYFYRDAEDISDSSNASSGLIDDASDTRHYSTLCLDGAYAQISNSYTVGAAINYWARSGGKLSIHSSSSNFGGESLRAEGFKGIGTSGGSELPLQNFQVKGVRCPRVVSLAEIKDPANTIKIWANASIDSTSENDKISLASRLDESVFFPYSLRPGTVIWADKLDGSGSVKATLADPPLSSNSRKILVESADNEFNGEAADSLSAPYLRRFVDPRPDFEKGYSLWLQNSSSTHKPPSTSDVLRFSERPSTASQDLLAPGRQLDPGENGGWNHVFAVEYSVTLENGNNPNYFEGGAPSPSQRSTGYYVSLRLEDSFGPWGGSFDSPTSEDLLYAEGSFVTLNERPYYAALSQLTDNVISPETADSTWARALTFAYCQPTGQAYVPSGYNKAKDPNLGDYPDGSTYLRGVGAYPSDYALSSILDEDNGSANFGLNSGDIGNPNKFDPSFSHSKQAILRFFRLLGYSEGSLSSLLVPKPWSERNLAVADLPTLGSGGYALSAGEWPVEFNEASQIVSSNHSWEWAGYFSYTKGLPAYQESPLSKIQHFDSLASSAWGGHITATGLTEHSEEVHIGTIEVNGRGKAYNLG